MISNRRLYTDPTKRLILEEGDERAAFLIVGKDCLSTRVFGLHVDQYLQDHPTAPAHDESDSVVTEQSDLEMEQTSESKTEADPESKQVDDADTKSIAEPPATKAIRPQSNKRFSKRR